MTSDVAIAFPAPDANKYSRGKLVVVAGSDRYPGAAVLAARAGQRMGAGYTEVVTDARVVDTVRAASPSLVVRAVAAWDADEVSEVKEGRPLAVCVGPGFESGNSASDDVVADVLRLAACPVLVDGGALTFLATKRGMKRLAKRAEKGLATIVTPHAGEAARLARTYGLREGMAPEKLAAGLALALRAIVVLKGPDTYISDGKQTVVMTQGSPALAKAGTGDVLAGMISALLAQGVDPFESAITGATVHAWAGSYAAEIYTEVCVCAEDVVEAIPAVIRSARADGVVPVR